MSHRVYHDLKIIYKEINEIWPTSTSLGGAKNISSKNKTLFPVFKKLINQFVNSVSSREGGEFDQSGAMMDEIKRKY